jgi:hypothetical protein
VNVHGAHLRPAAWACQRAMRKDQRFRKAASALEYAADLTPVVAAKEASASWNARGMAETA